MKSFILIGLFLLNHIFGVSSFAFYTPTTTLSCSTTTTSLFGTVSPEEMTKEQMEIYKIQQQWNQIRHLSKEEIVANTNLEDKWKEAHGRYLARYEKDMNRMKEIQEKLVSMENVKVAKKTLGQKKRDKWAKIQARTLARSQAAAALIKKK